MSETFSNLGKRGEQQVLNHLLKQGYKLISRNFSTRFGEIDLIMREEKTLVFIEVKTRKNIRYGHGFEAITSRKQLRLQKTAIEFLRVANIIAPTRFDAVFINNQSRKLFHLKNFLKLD